MIGPLLTSSGLPREERSLDPQPSGSSKTAQTQKNPLQPRTSGYDVSEINRNYALVITGSKAMVIKEHADGPVEDRQRLLSIGAFCTWHSNLFTEIAGEDGRRRKISWAKRWLMDRERRQYAGLEFFPNPDGAEGTPGYLNLWRGFAHKPASSGSWALFRDHLLNNICDGKPELFNWVFGWFAHLIQFPRERPGTALVLRGGMGVGKSIVGEIIGALIPAHHFPVGSARYVVSNFNLHLAKCLLLQSEEAVWAGDKHAEGTLKDLITSDTLMIEAKGIDAIRLPNRVRLMMTSNEDWVAPAGHGERRFCVLDVNPRCAGNFDYFSDMLRELDEGGYARLLYDLQHFDLGKVNLRKIPRTGALLYQQLRTLNPLDAWWHGRLIDGAPTRHMDGWARSVEIDALYKDYLKTAEEIGASRRCDSATFGVRMQKLVPAVRRTRPRRGGVRRWHYALPPLEECRSAFEQLMGQTLNWPADEVPIDDNSGAKGDDSDVIEF